MFLKNIIKKAKFVVDTTEDIDNHFFAQVMIEIENGTKDKGLNGKAIAMSGGDEAKANSLYVEMRAKNLQEIFLYDEEERINMEKKTHILILAEKKKRAEEIKKEQEEKTEKDETIQLIYKLLKINRIDYFLDLMKEELEIEGFYRTSFLSFHHLKKDGRSFNIAVSPKEKIMIVHDSDGKRTCTFKLEEKLNSLH